MGTDFILWMNQQLPLFNKNPFVLIPIYICRLCGSLPWQQPSAACLPGFGFAFWLELGSPGVCTAALQWQFDGVLLPILPSLNRSCCHLYFDLCIPWSIYACERWERRRGEEGREQVEKRKTATTTILAAFPEGTPAVHLPFKSSSADRHSTEAELQSPPMSIETVCAFCSRRQKKVSFNCTLAPWKGLNGAAHRWGN